MRAWYTSLIGMVLTLHNVVTLSLTLPNPERRGRVRETFCKPEQYRGGLVPMARLLAPISNYLLFTLIL